MPIPKALANKIEGKNEIPPAAEVVTAVVMDRAGVRCRVCAHPQRTEIENQFATLKPAGIAKWLRDGGMPQVPAPIIAKHFETCVVKEILLSKNGQRSAENFLARVDKLVSRMEGYLDDFDEQDPDKQGPKDWKGLSAMANQLRASLELLGKASGHLGPDIEINIVESPQFIAIAAPIAQITAKCAHCGPAVKNILTDGDE